MSRPELRGLWFAVLLLACGDGGASVDEAIDAGAPDDKDAGEEAFDAAMAFDDASVIEDAAVTEDAATVADASRGPDEGPEDASTADSAVAPAVYAEAITDYQPGANAGFGQTKLPDVVLGPPRGGGTGAGSLDVLSLGVGGSIVLDMGEAGIVDGAGADFLVFENAFWPGGDGSRVFAELGEVSISSDGSTWHVFVCDTAGVGFGRYPGCAGWTPTLAYDPTLSPLDPTTTGGDGFDLATLGQAAARYVRIRDLSTTGAGTTAGFDLDAVGVIHRGP